MARIVASVACRAAADLVAAAADPGLAGLADAIEVRLDAVWSDTPDPDAAADLLLALRDATPKPLIATLRPERQGGRWQGPEEVRLGLLASAARAGFETVDLEVEAAVPAVTGTLAAAGATHVASLHLGETPCRDDGLRFLTLLQDAHGSWDKLGFEAGSFPELLRAFELAVAHRARGGRPAVATTGMGGAELRAALGLAGNQVLYGHAPRSPPAAPGQPDVQDLAALLSHWGLTSGELGTGAPWLAVLGEDVGASRSPRMMNAALRAAGRPERFGALQVPASAGALRLAFHAAKRIGLAGASVTAPHKETAASALPCTPAASAVGAANCVRFGDDPLATNTDATGLLRLLPPGGTAWVVGSGGAARAALWALGERKADATFVSRNEARAQPVARAFGAAWRPATQDAPDRQFDVAVYTALAQPVRASLQVVLPYGPAADRFASSLTGSVLDGRHLLLEQGVDAYEWWFGAAAPRAAMASALGMASATKSPVYPPALPTA